MAMVAATAVSQGTALSPIGGATAAGAASPTTVSIEFDDGIDKQFQTGAMLNAHNMDATYYINSGTRPPGFATMSWAQLHTLADAGHEIGGHTIDHADLPTLSASAAQAQICNDRTALQAQGFTVSSFAFPYGHNTPALWSTVQNCGYTSGRDVSGIVSPEGCAGCPFAETIPPANPFLTRTPENVYEDMPVSELQGFVTQAENNGGGWVQLVFHDICIKGSANCDFYSMSPANFNTFLDWLALRPSSTVVRTVGQVMGGAAADSTAPSSSITCNSSTCSSNFYGASVQVALSATDTGGSGLSVIRYTTDGTTPTKSGAGGTTYTAPFSVTSTKTVKYQAWDNANNVESTHSQLIQVDTTAPVSSILCNAAACSSSSYSPPVQVTLSATDTGGSGVAAIRYTTNGADPTGSSTPYSGPISVSSTTTLKYRAYDNAGIAEATKSRLVSIDTEAPVSTIACNAAPCAGGWYAGPVQVSLSATDNGGSGFDVERYTTDGSDPTVASTVYSAPFAVATSATVKARGWDHAGNAETPKSQAIAIDTIAPVASIKCNALPCSDAWSHSSVQVTLSATDNVGGSAVAAIRYTTDGSDPSLASALYSGPVAVGATSTVKYRAFDNAGNAGAVHAQSVNVDLISPDASIKCNGGGCSNSWSRNAVKVALAATDAGGSGVASLRFTTDGSTPTATSPIYTKALTVSATRWVKFRAFDNAGNAGGVKATLVRVDVTKPIIGFSSPGVQPLAVGKTISVHATDAKSGLVRAIFYVDGKRVATRTKAAFSFTWNPKHAAKGKHILKVKAIDVAGNSIVKTITVTVH